MILILRRFRAHWLFLLPNLKRIFPKSRVRSGMNHWKQMCFGKKTPAPFIENLFLNIQRKLMQQTNTKIYCVLLLFLSASKCQPSYMHSVKHGDVSSIERVHNKAHPFSSVVNKTLTNWTFRHLADFTGNPEEKCECSRLSESNLELCCVGS